MGTSLQYTPLNEQQDVSDTSFPTGFDAAVAYLMGQCCQATYNQLAGWNYSSGTSSYDVTSGLTAVTITASNAPIPITSYEPLDFGVSPTASNPETGMYVPLPFGFALQVTASSIGAFNVIALRGTQSYEEWLTDATALPATFNLGTATPGFVHDGFYQVYTRGAPGDSPSTGSGAGANRIPGSIAAQVQTIIEQIGDKDTPLYVTGHSLGAALATLCAMDLVQNWGEGSNGACDSWQSLNVYVLASPQVAAGFALPSDFISFLVSTQSIDNALATVLSGDVLKLVEAVAAGLSSALSTVVANDVDASGNLFPTSWSTAFPSGAYGIVHAADIVPILPPSTLTSPNGLGVTFAQAVPSAETVNFCAQTGDVGGNHSIDTYLWYLQQIQS